MNIIDLLDYIGIAAFAVSGAITAVRKKMDYFGIFFIACVTAIGGGVIRDIIIKDGLPTFFLRIEYIVIILISAGFVILTKGQIRWIFALDLFDALGLATFTIEAGIIALEMHLNFVTFAFVSLITAVGGGILRDMMSREIPRILRKEIYAVLSIVGSTLFWFLQMVLDRNLAAYICIAIIFILRIVAIRFSMRIPIVNTRTEKTE